MLLKRTNKRDLSFVKSLFAVYKLGIDRNHESRMKKKGLGTIQSIRTNYAFFKKIFGPLLYFSM